MIPQYINNWFREIESMKNENTYKLAWGRALVECIYHGQCVENLEGKIAVSLEDIAKCIVDLLDTKFSIEIKDAIVSNYIDKYYFECRM